MSGPWEKYKKQEPGPWEKYGSPVFQSTPGGAAVGLTAPRGVADTVSGRDPGIDYSTGIPNAKFRAGLSFMSGPGEKASFLDEQVGKDNWGQDTQGAYYIKPEGLKKFGITSSIPVSIDEHKATRYDITDIAGDAPAIAGAAGMGMASTGLGAVPGVALTALGGAGGKAYAELGKNILGYRQQPVEDVAKSILTEGATAGLGEGLFRVAKPVIGFAAGPGARRMTPEKIALAKTAQEEGFKIRPGSLTEAPLLARWEGMVRNIFGDLHEQRNREAAKAGIEKLAGKAGTPASKVEAGEAVSTSIKAARVQFGNEMASLYNFPGAEVPTAPLKQAAKDIMESLPKSAKGVPVMTSPETTKFLTEISQLPDVLSASHMQRIRTMLREASESTNLVPGVMKHDARTLRKAVDKSMDGVEGLREANKQYREGIRRFDNTVVSAITRDAGKPGAIDPDMVVDYLIKPERSFRVNQVKKIVSKEDWAKVKSAHARDLLSQVERTTDDPLKTFFDGEGFRNLLNNYGRETLEAVHGKEWTDAAYRYAHSLMLANKRMKVLSGGIVAANIALHPIVNLPKLVFLRAMAQMVEQPGTFKYLTEGLTLGPGTKKGAEAFGRLAAQASVLARDETGVSPVYYNAK